MKYQPTADEFAVAEVVARRRNSLNGGQTNLPNGEVASASEREAQHLRAALAEIAVARAFNLSWTGCGKGANGLRDVGGLFEVRSIARETNGLLARSKDADDAPCVLVLVPSLRDVLCSLLGWQFFSVVKAEGRVLDAGSRSPCWVLPQSRLEPLEAIGKKVPVVGQRVVAKLKGWLCHNCQERYQMPGEHYCVWCAQAKERSRVVSGRA